MRKSRTVCPICHRRASKGEGIVVEIQGTSMSKLLLRRLRDFLREFQTSIRHHPISGRHSITFGPAPVTLTRSSRLSPHELQSGLVFPPIMTY